MMRRSARFRSLIAVPLPAPRATAPRVPGPAARLASAALPASLRGQLVRPHEEEEGLAVLRGHADLQGAVRLIPRKGQRQVADLTEPLLDLRAVLGRVGLDGRVDLPRE